MTVYFEMIKEEPGYEGGQTSFFSSVPDCSTHSFPGYAFLLFQEESSVQALIEACMEEDGKLYLCVSSPTIKDKPVSSSC